MNIIFLKNIFELVAKRSENGPVTEASYLASILKNKRLSLGMTLQEATENICSEAFLSKVERNLMDPKNNRVEMLCERLNLDYYGLLNLESNDRVEQMLELFFKEDYETILILEDKMCDDVFIAQDEIIKAYKALINEDYKKLNEIVIKLDAIKECLNDIELFSLILVVFEFYMRTLQYKKAKSYIELLMKININNEKCKQYIIERNFILACLMESSETKYLFNELRCNFTRYPISKQFKYIMYYNAYLGTVEALENLENMKKDYIPKEYIEEYQYAICKVLVKLNKLSEAMNYIKTINSTNIKFSVLYAYSLTLLILRDEEIKESKTSDKELELTEEKIKKYKHTLIELIKKANQTSIDTYHIAFLRLMQYEIDHSDKEVICNYIKNQLLKELADFSYPLYDNYINYRYCVILGKLCRYKEAYMFLFGEKKNLKKNLF